MCVTAFAEWPAGRAALLAHPLAAEALVVALERLRAAPPGPDNIAVMSALVLAMDEVYQSEILPVEAAAASTYSADPAPTWCQPALLQRLVGVLVPLATGTAAIAGHAARVLINLPRIGPTASAAVLSSPALHAALPRFILSSCSSSDSTSSSGNGSSKDCSSSSSSSNNSSRTTSSSNSVLSAEVARASRIDADRAQSARGLLQPGARSAGLGVAAGMVVAANKLASTQEYAAARSFTSSAPILRAAVRAFVKCAARVVSQLGSCDGGGGRGSSGGGANDSGGADGSGGSSNSGGTGSSGRGRIAGDRREGEDSQASHGGGVTRGVAAVACTVSPQEDWCLGAASLLLTELVNSRTNEAGGFKPSECRVFSALLEEEGAISDVAASITAAWADDPPMESEVWQFLAQRWPMARLSDAPPLLLMSGEERQLAVSFCAGCGASKDNAKLRECSGCHQAAFCGVSSNPLSPGSGLPAWVFKVSCYLFLINSVKYA